MGCAETLMLGSIVFQRPLCNGGLFNCCVMGCAYHWTLLISTFHPVISQLPVPFPHLPLQKPPFYSVSNVSCAVCWITRELSWLLLLREWVTLGCCYCSWHYSRVSADSLTACCSSSLTPKLIFPTQVTKADSSSRIYSESLEALPLGPG